MSLGQASIDVTADTSQFESGLKSGVGKAAKAIGVGVAAVGALAAGAVAATLKLGGMADELLDLSAITGASTDKLQEMRFVASQAGTNTDFYANSVNQLSRSMSDIEEGTGKQAEAIERLGISTRTASGEMKSAEQITDEAIGALAGMTDESQRAQLATDIFSRKANDLIPVLALGSDEINRMSQEAHDLGGVLDEDALNSANQFRMSVEELKTSAQGLANEALANLAPMLTQMAQTVQAKVLPAARAGVERFGELWKVFSQGDGIVDGLKRVFGELTGGGGIGSIMQKVRDVVQNVFSSIVNWLATGGITQILNTLLDARERLLNAAMVLFPVILQALIDFVPELLGFITEQLIPAILDLIINGVPMLLEAAVTLFDSLITAVTEVLPVLLETLLGTVLPRLLATVLGMVPQLLNTAFELFTALVDAIVQVLPEILTTLLGTVLPNVLSTLLEMIPRLVTTAITVFTALITGLLDVLPELLTTIIGEVLPDLIVTLIEMIPQLLETAVIVFMALVEGLIEVIPELVTAIVVDVIPALVTAIVEGVPQIIGAAKDLLAGMVTGIREKAGEVIAALKRFVLDKIPDFIKDFFGISSPSKMFFGFGHDLIDGLIKGIGDAAGGVKKAVDLVAGAAADGLSGLSVTPAVGGLGLGGLVPAGLGAGGGTVFELNLNVTVNGQISQREADFIGERIGDKALERLSRARLVR